MASIKYFLWLTTRRGFQPVDACRLLEHFGTPEGAFFADPEEYELLGLPPFKRKSLADKSLDGAERILEQCDKLDIRILTIQDAEYPERLAQIYDPPCVLYVKGKTLAYDEALAVGVVGTRKCTPYGEKVAGRLGLELARSGAMVVSGIAEGLDSAALKGALQGGGTVTSVLGGGIDIIYPRQNKYLYQDVAAAGALISEYPPGTEHSGFHFPIRNRILSGLSVGVAVVEAGIPSGALISARHALEQNREVFAVPGPVDAPASRGTNLIIQRGEAKLITNANDILCEFSGLFSGIVRHAEPLPLVEADSRLAIAVPEEKPDKAAEKVVDKEPERAYITLSDDPEAFTDDERDILLAIQKTSLTADDIVDAAQIPARRVLSALTMLQVRAMVEEKPGKRFYANVVLRP